MHSQTIAMCTSRFEPMPRSHRPAVSASANSFAVVTASPTHILTTRSIDRSIHIFASLSRSRFFFLLRLFASLCDCRDIFLQFDRLTHLRVRSTAKSRRRSWRRSWKKKWSACTRMHSRICESSRVQLEQSYIIWLISDTHPHINVRSIDCKAHTNLVYVMHISTRLGRSTCIDCSLWVAATNDDYGDENNYIFIFHAKNKRWINEKKETTKWFH